MGALNILLPLVSAMRTRCSIGGYMTLALRALSTFLLSISFALNSVGTCEIFHAIPTFDRYRLN